MWCAFILKVGRLPHINFFFEDTMKKCIVHIKLS
jgi:hypothetical protein